MRVARHTNVVLIILIIWGPSGEPRAPGVPLMPELWTFRQYEDLRVPPVLVLNTTVETSVPHSTPNCAADEQDDGAASLIGYACTKGKNKDRRLP